MSRSQVAVHRPRLPAPTAVGSRARRSADAQLAALAKALGHPVRVRIVRLLAKQERCMYGSIADMLPLALSTVSQHLQVLHAAGLIRSEVSGPKVCYCIDRDALARLKALVAELGPGSGDAACCAATERRKGV